jgi:hypothetical protein
MKFVNEADKVGKTIQTNDIPVGQVFRGQIWGNYSKRWRKGIFYKAQGALGGLLTRSDGSQSKFDVIVVQLNEEKSPSDGFGNGWFTCSAVENYEPLDVEVVIKGVK